MPSRRLPTRGPELLGVSLPPQAWGEGHRLVLLPPNQNWSPWPESHNSGVERVCPRVVVCVRAWVRVVEEPGASLLALLLALQVIIQWGDLAAAGRALSSFGVSSLLGRVALSPSLTGVPSAVQRQDSVLPS